MPKLMASPFSIDHSLIPLSLLFLTLNLLSSVLRSLRRSNGLGARCFQPAVRSALLIYLSTILSHSEFVASPTKHRMSELEEMKIQVTKLETLFEDKSILLDSRILELEKCQKMIEEMDKKIGFLHETLIDLKASYAGSAGLNENIRAMNEKVLPFLSLPHDFLKVQQLWDKSRRNNFNIHVSESKTWESVKKMEEVASKVEKMQNIINEQWIQVQQLEQSLQLTKVMTSRVNKKILSDGQKKRKSNDCLVSRLGRSIARHSYSKIGELPDSFFLGGSIPKSSLIKAISEFKRTMSSVRKKHHELQYMVYQVMEMNDYTSSLAHREFIFFMASLITLLPLMMAWILLYSAFIG